VAQGLRYAAKRIKGRELLIIATNLDEAGRGLVLQLRLPPPSDSVFLQIEKDGTCRFRIGQRAFQIGGTRLRT